jgi:hypothetical protein
MNWKEIISRFTMLVFAAGIAGIGLLFAIAGRFMLPSAPKLAFPFFVAAGFIWLIGGTLLCFAFMPGQDTPRGPPRGFAEVNAVFEFFWKAVEKLFEKL